MAESNKSLKERVKNELAEVKMKFDKANLEVDSKVEIMKTKIHNDIEGIKSALVDLPSFEKT